MKKRLFRRTQTAAPFGQMFGVEIFRDSRLLRIVLCQLHFDTVDGDSGDTPPFPLADVGNPAMTNANHVLSVLRQHQADERVYLVNQFRYFHRDSQDPYDGLDLKRRFIHTASVRDEHEIEAMVLDFCRVLTTDERFVLCAPPAVYNLSWAPIDVAIKALTTLPFIQTRVGVDGGLQ